MIGPLKPNQYNEAPKPNKRTLSLKIKLDVSEVPAPEQSMAQVSSVIKKKQFTAVYRLLGHYNGKLGKVFGSKKVSYFYWNKSTIFHAI